MRRNLIGITCLLLVGTFLVGCGGSANSQAIKLNKQFVKLTEDYVDGIDKADSAKDVAAVMNKYADGLETLMPKMRALVEKHPELKDTASLPDNVKAAQKETEAVAKKMVGCFMKIVKYRDPEVKAAQERISRAMKG